MSLRSKNPFLSLTNATFRLGDRLIFENTSWSLGRNEHWGIVGPNGCGKSFFGEALLGHLPLVHGELTWQFKPARGFSTEDCIGHVAFEDRKSFVRGQVMQSRWQSFEQDHAATVDEALSYEQVMDVNPFEVTERHGREKRRFEQRRRRAIKLLGIERLLDRKLMVLSNGETQKVHLARALSKPLRLLILDEPFTGLDVKSREHFYRVLRKLMSTDLRVIVITADATNLPKGITHVMRIEDFRVVRIERFAPPLELSRSSLSVDDGKSGPDTSGHPKTWRNVKRPIQGCANPPPYVGGYKASELVRMRNVTVRYGGRPVLRNIDWTIRLGESWALLGPNGSGKTTLLSLISGDHPQAYSNDITVLGREFGSGDSVWDLKKKIGIVSPELQLHFPDSFTCLEVVESGFRETMGLYEEISKRERDVALRWLARFGLRKFADVPLFELSAGQQRTALLARALVKRPALLILDEPCQGLDTAHREVFLRILDRLIREGKETVIYVTHNEKEIPGSIKRVMRLGM